MEVLQTCQDVTCSKKVFKEIFQSFQETKFQNIVHGFFETYPEVLFEHAPVDFVTNIRT